MTKQHIATVDISHDRFSMEDAFKLRDKANELAETSAVFWESLSEEEREVLNKIASHCFRVMAENVDQFLPAVISSREGGDMICIESMILMSSIEGAVQSLPEPETAEAKVKRLEAALERIMSGHSTVAEMRAEAADALGPWEAPHE